MSATQWPTSNSWIIIQKGKRSDVSVLWADNMNASIDEEAGDEPAAKADKNIMIKRMSLCKERQDIDHVL